MPLIPATTLNGLMRNGHPIRYSCNSEGIGVGRDSHPTAPLGSFWWENEVTLGRGVAPNIVSIDFAKGVWDWCKC